MASAKGHNKVVMITPVANMVYQCKKKNAKLCFQWISVDFVYLCTTAVLSLYCPWNIKDIESDPMIKGIIYFRDKIDAIK